MWSRLPWVLATAAVAGGLYVVYAPQGGWGRGAEPPPAVSSAPPPDRVSALGRLEPKDGVIYLAGPSDPSVVIAKLYVDKGDRVRKGQLLADLDTLPVRAANVRRLEAELANARRDLQRTVELHRDAVVSDSQRDDLQLKVRVAEADLAAARAELDRAHVYSPIGGTVLKVHAREGERVGPDGILELGRTDHMYAIAEVFEEDIDRVRLGQRAVVKGPELERPLKGTVDWINLRVAKQDVLGDDPAARKDARVVEVEVRLDHSREAARLTHAQVEVEIGP